MKKGIKTAVLFICIALSVFFCFAYSKSEKKIGYVTTAKVFDGFKLKKELEGKYKRVQIARQTFLDSLKLNIQEIALKSTSTKSENERLNELRKVYLLKEEQVNKENQRLYDEYNEQIWKQLNQYMADFGKENNYDYVLGASGQGSIMYAKESNDATTAMIEYVNKKYNGKNH
ncbi:MAG: OmpH family outer membrane protein [Bacteroidia bacterium]|nr:OmpH family outer membrane protein [Bacteroidia bacterium]